MWIVWSLIVITNEGIPSCLAWTIPTCTAIHNKVDFAAISRTQIPLNFGSDDVLEKKLCNRRRMLTQIRSFGALLLGGSVAVSHPSRCAAAEENDPFAAMDTAISTGLTTNNFNDSSKMVSPNVMGTTGQPQNPKSPSQSDAGSNVASWSSDLEKALQESQRRRTIDPRTHG
jgi:hypothetical protein